MAVVSEFGAPNIGNFTLEVVMAQKKSLTKKSLKKANLSVHVSRRERKFRRFNIEWLAHVKFPSGEAIAEAEAVTRNISHCGLLLESPCLIPYRSPVEFTLTVPGESTSRPVKITGAGQVVRIEPTGTADGFGIAVACREPITLMEHHLNARG
jgi:hypothetical protein